MAPFGNLLLNFSPGAGGMRQGMRHIYIYIYGVKCVRRNFWDQKSIQNLMAYAQPGVCQSNSTPLLMFLNVFSWLRHLKAASLRPMAPQTCSLIIFGYAPDMRRAPKVHRPNARSQDSHANSGWGSSTCCFFALIAWDLAPQTCPPIIFGYAPGMRRTQKMLSRHCWIPFSSEFHLKTHSHARLLDRTTLHWTKRLQKKPPDC